MNKLMTIFKAAVSNIINASISRRVRAFFVLLRITVTVVIKAGDPTTVVSRTRKAVVGRLANTFLKPEFILDLFLLAGRNTLLNPCLRRSVQPHLFMGALLTICFCFTACVKDFDINVKANKPMLVVEAYINNEMREYNYVVLSRSLDYLSLDFQSAPVANATVTITEGERFNNDYKWDPATKVQLFEANFPAVPANFRMGVYFDPRLVTDSLNALLGSPGKSYLLEIKEGQNEHTAIATLLRPVPIDSLTTGFGFIDEEDGNKKKLRITNHYQDPIQ
jgi:hypothetical protein